MIEHQYADNPNHSLSEHVQKALDDARSARMDALAKWHQLSVDCRPSPEEREKFRSIERAAFTGDQAEAKDFLEGYERRVGRIGWSDYRPDLSPLDTAPRAAGADFWWAQTQALPLGL